MNIYLNDLLLGKPTSCSFLHYKFGAFNCHVKSVSSRSKFKLDCGSEIQDRTRRVKLPCLKHKAFFETHSAFNKRMPLQRRGSKQHCAVLNTTNAYIELLLYSCDKNIWPEDGKNTPFSSIQLSMLFPCCKMYVQVIIEKFKWIKMLVFCVLRIFFWCDVT